MVVGILDGGLPIPLDGEDPHPSFDEVSDDGFVHTNPLGDGQYLGGCVDHPEWCNGKVIGVHNELITTEGLDTAAPDEDPVWGFKDLRGHGAAVSSVAAGNVVFDVPVYDYSDQPIAGVPSFERVSGIAPRANIVHYKVCSGDDFCWDVDIASAVEQAIEDGVVDVLNHSIGDANSPPWEGYKSSAFLSAYAAGILVVQSASNRGPNEQTIGVTAAPWVLSIAATTHDRVFETELGEFSGGAGEPPAAMTARSVSDGFSGRIVDAADYPFGMPGEPSFEQPGQCAVEFPPDTFEADMMVVCEDLGSVGRYDKSVNVQAGGAGGIVIARLADSDRIFQEAPGEVPSVLIGYDDGVALREWLDSGGDDHRASFAAPQYEVAPDGGGTVVSFSSRGPYRDDNGDSYDILAPSMAAAGAGIYSAGAALAEGMVVNDPMITGRFGMWGGTSAASPQVAGAAVLLRAIHPGWSNAAIYSALTSTARPGLNVEEGPAGAEPGDPLDYGTGLLSIDRAVRAGLLFEETSDAIVQANPVEGGVPKSLNLASAVDETCVSRCEWTRTVTAAAAGTWSIESSSDRLTVDPPTIKLAEGESQSISILLDVDGVAADQYEFGRVILTPFDESFAEQAITVAGRSTFIDLPRRIDILASSDEGSVTVDDTRSIAINELSSQVTGLVRADQTTLALLGDTDNSGPYDDLNDGNGIVFVDLPEGDGTFIVETLTDADSEGTDFDMYVGYDLNGDGLPSFDEEVCVGWLFGPAESCVFDFEANADENRPPVWVISHAWGTAAPDVADEVLISTAVVPNGQSTGNFTVSGPEAPVDALALFDVTYAWDDEMDVGELFFGHVDYYGNPEQSEDLRLGSSFVRLERGPGEDPGGTTTGGEGDTTDGELDDSTGSVDEGGTDGPGTPAGSSSTGGGEPGADGDGDGGCGCRSTPAPSPATLMFFGLVAVGLRRRRWPATSSRT